MFYLDNKIGRFWWQTNSADFCMTDDRFLLADFIGRRNWPTLSFVGHQLYVGLSWARRACVSGWSAILSRRSLRACNEKLRAACMTCRQLSDTAVPCVVSACVISTELHPNIHIMIDAVKPDDNQRARRSMSTPTDSSCTHILVFPTSATAQV